MFDSAIKNFAQNLKALRDFVELIRPFLREHAEELTKTHLDDVAPVLAAIIRHNLKVRKHIVSRAGDDEHFKKLLKDFPSESKVDEKGNVNITISLDRVNPKKVLHGLEVLTSSLKQEELLYKSSLLNLISSAEWFLSQILHLYFETFPDAIGTKENVFSLDDLKRFETVDDARRFLIDSKVEGILRESFEDWIRHLKQKVGLSMSYLDSHHDLISEVFQRRNIIVHNGGIVNAIYLSRVSPELTEDLKVGSPIKVTPSYFGQSIDTIELNFTLMAAELWKKLAPEDEQRGEVLLDLAFSHLVQEKWKLGEGLSQFLVMDKLMAEGRRVRAQLNYWQALKWQGRFEEVREKVEKTDYSAKKSVFGLAILALLDKEEEFFELLPSVLRTEGLSYEELDSWPIFRQVREGKTYREFRDKHSDKFDERGTTKTKTSKKNKSLPNKKKVSASRKTTKRLRSGNKAG